MMLNLIDALSSLGNPVGRLVGILAIAAIAFVGDTVVLTLRPGPTPRGRDEGMVPQVQIPCADVTCATVTCADVTCADVTCADVRGPIAVPR